MSGFWIIVAAIAVTTVALLLLPLIRQRQLAARRTADALTIYKDQLKKVESDLEYGLLSPDQANTTRLEIQHHILSLTKTTGQEPEITMISNKSVLSFIFIGGFIILSSFFLYAHLGHPYMPNMPASESLSIQSRDKDATSHDMIDMIAKIAERLKKNPDDPNGWDMLGYFYMNTNRYQEAIFAFQNAYNRLEDPLKAEVGIHLGEAIVLAKKGIIPPKAIKLFQKGVTVHPFHPKPRFYLAYHKAQTGYTKEALQGFIDIKAISPTNGSWIAVIEQVIIDIAKTNNVDPSTIHPTPEAMALAIKQRNKEIANKKPSDAQ